MRQSKRSATIALAFCAVLAITACSPPSNSEESRGDAKGASARVATSASEFGGMDALIDAAKKEGELNTVSMAPDWNNYAAVASGFTKKYGIKINSANPEGSSQDEITAVKRLHGTERAPDVLDLGPRELSDTSLFAPYKVATWQDIPESQKEATGLWYQDYGGYMSIGYDASKVPPITSVQDLLKPDYRGKVALFADPTQSTAAMTAVLMVSLASGGSLDDVSAGVDFFRKMKQLGNFVPVRATSATIANGTTPVVINWDYALTSIKSEVPDWKLFIPSDALVAGYYAAAINKDAPHPAAARLWEEWLFSDEVQNLFLQAYAHPVRLDAMVKADTVDDDALRSLPEVAGVPHSVDPTQADKAKTYLQEHWAQATG